MTVWAKLEKELIIVHEGGCRNVAMLPAVKAEFEKIEQRWRKKLQTHFLNYGIPGTSLPQEQYNSEGRHPTGGKNSKDLQLFAFKAHQHRLYGAVIAVGGVETFVGMELVTDKKTNKADQSLLQRVAKKFGNYLD